MKLSKLRMGETIRVEKVGGDGALRQHFLDMGIIPGHVMTFVKAAPMGDPLEFRISGYELTLRKSEADKIEGTYANEIERQGVEIGARDGVHPGLGQGGKYHSKDHHVKVAEGTIIKFALAGQQNCGKTTLFNSLTGSNQHVGNFPGVTVDRKEGIIKGYKNSKIIDLPGIYSMSPYSSEELVSRDFILEENPNGIINIVDAMNIERNLYLTLQLMELGKPMVLALNMMDEVRNNRGEILVNEMEEILGIPVVAISAAKNEGVQELAEHAYHVASYDERPGLVDFCDENESGEVHRALHGIMHLIEDHAKKTNIPLRFAASKVAEGDEVIIEKLNLDDNEKEMLEHIITQMEKESGLDRAAAIAAMRYSFINKLCNQTVIKPKESKEHIRSRRLDKILTGKFTAIPCFFVVMALIFFLTFNVIGPFLQNVLNMGISELSDIVNKIMINEGVNPVIHKLVIEGIFNGVGSIISFLPIIVILFLFLSLLEDSGYIARVAFVMDKPLRKLGLSGRSIVPLLVGFGCSVPAVMSTRTLSSDRDRKMTIVLTPFMSCSAKLPVYSFFALAFFPKYSGIVITSLYIIGVLAGIIIAYIYKKTIFSGEASPFVMELPNYRMPGIRNTFQLLWEKAKDFLTKAVTVIMIATIVVWFLKTFDMHLNIVKNPEDALLAVVSGWITPIFKPMGLGNWKITTSLLSGIIAKESVVSTMTILMGKGKSVLELMNPASAVAMLIFSLLYTPCIAAIATVKREFGRKWAIFLSIWQSVIAWIFAYIAFLIASIVL